MPLLIQTNVASLEAQKNLSRTQELLGKTFRSLSSGLRINSAADDAAGLAISESMRMQIRSYTVASRNANDGISMAQTAEGALGELHSIFGRMRELAMQGANGSIGTGDRDYLQTEFNQLQREVSRIVASTKFNGVDLITSTSSDTTFQVGIGNTTADRITVQFGGFSLAALVSSSTTVASTAGNSQTAMTRIDAAISLVSTARARFGAVMNRFSITVSNLETARVNASASESRIRDVDVAAETASLSRQQVLQQAGIAVLSQANQIPQAALALLRG